MSIALITIFSLLQYQSVPSGYSIVGKLLCYHASDTDSIPLGGHTTKFPYLLVLLDQLSLPSIRGR